MVDVKVYMTGYCPYCARAKELLRRKGVSFDEIDVAGDDALREQMVRDSGRRTVPQIFINGQSIGGFDELKALDEEGRLDCLLGVA